MRKVIITLLAIITVLCLPSCQKKESGQLNVEDIRAICELSTVKCYYNNVGEYKKSKDNIFQKDRKMWIEYEGIAVLGVDMSKLEIEVNGNNVNIKMPEAEILSIHPNRATLNEKSYVVSSDGWLFKNKITTEDQEAGITQGEEEMKKAIKGNAALFLMAETKAKNLIENYITEISKAIGTEYTINWN